MTPAPGLWQRVKLVERGCIMLDIMLKRRFRMRQLLSAIAVLVALFCLTAAAVYAEDAIKIFVNGKEIGSDVPPQIVEGRTLVPLRTVAEALGAQVEWDQNTRSVIITEEAPAGDAPKLLKVDGEQTPWPYWYENGNLYLEYHNLIELLRMKYSNYVISYSKNNNYLTLSSTVYSNTFDSIPVVKRGDYYTLSATYLYTARNLIQFEFDPETGNLRLLSSS
jgi:hypothetical protein